MSELPFESWHPDAQRECGFWKDIAVVPCYRCDRCHHEYVPRQEVATYVNHLHEIIRRYRSIVRYDSPSLESAASEALQHPLSQRLRLPK